MLVLGVDPGLEGGLAIIRGGVKPILIAVISIPTTGEKAKRRVDVGAVLSFLRDHQLSHAFVERAQSMPDQGSSSGFRYGRAVGAIEACVEALKIPQTTIEASAWKKAHSLIHASKEDSRQRAIKLFPGTDAFARKKDHNRAEAALIAYYGLKLLGHLGDCGGIQSLRLLSLV